MVKEKITLSIEEKILKKFKEKAEKECWNISKKIEQLIKEFLKKGKK